jgi:hypothetical protein
VINKDKTATKATQLIHFEKDTGIASLEKYIQNIRTMNNKQQMNIMLG